MSESWFDAWPEYSGVGSIFFKGGATLEGPGTARLDRFGQVCVEMEVDPSRSSSDLERDTLRLLAGGEPEEFEGGRSIPLMATPRTSESICIANEEGVFEVLSGHHYDFSVGDATRLRVKPLQSRFVRSNAGSPAYWVVPLVNFVSGFRPHDAALGKHPLRLRQFDSDASRREDGKRDATWLRDTSRNRYIPFEYSGELAFIEPLADYAAREASLLAGQQRSAITAIMVGSIPAGIADVQDVYSWVPVDLTMPLSMASGVQVSAAWVELRDAEGLLVTRAHRPGFPCFTKGYRFIDEGIHRGTGHLLTRWLEVAHGKRDALVAATRNVVLSGHYGARTLDEGMRHAAVAIEMLCKDIGVKTVPSLRDRKSKKQLGAAVDCACGTIDALVDSASARGDSETADALGWVAKQIGGCKGPHPKFGHSVVALMRHEGLCDPDVMCPGYVSSPWRKKQKTWEALLSTYRGKAMHGELLSIKDKLEIDIVYHTTNHLRDAAVRVILKEIGYEMHYQPSLIVCTTSQPVDWVHEGACVADLGYGFAEDASVT